MRRTIPAVIATAVAAALAVSLPAGATPKGAEIPDGMASLTGKPGDPVNGRKLVVKPGGCLSCHAMPIPEEADHGHIGPELDEVAGRLGEDEIRLRIVDPKLVNPDTIMPAFHRKDGLHRVAAKWQDKTILTAQEVEDVVAYLMTLK